MLSHLRRSFGAAVVVAAFALLLSTAPALADGGMDPVNCDTNPTAPECVIEVIDDGQDGGQGGSGSDGTRCRDGNGKEVPCYIEKWGWLADDGCYYKLADPQLADALGRPLPPAQWYLGSCVDVATGQVFMTRLRIFATPPGLGLVAAEAVKRLRLPTPVIWLNPAPPAPQVVRLATWLWLDGSSWGERSATAAVPGLSVTATATPVRVTWSTGDGGSVSCDGPGVPWHAGMSPTAAPPCGYTYLRPSTGMPGGVFTLQATVTWQISWRGTGGITGREPNLQTTATVPLRVTESQAVNTGGQR